jgi:hypothetical protein
MAVFLLGGVLRGFSAAAYTTYASRVRPCPAEKILIYELDTQLCHLNLVDGHWEVPAYSTDAPAATAHHISAICNTSIKFHEKYDSVDRSQFAFLPRNIRQIDTLVEESFIRVRWHGIWIAVEYHVARGERIDPPGRWIT